MFPCTPLVYSLGALCSFFIYILLFTDQKKKYDFFFFFANKFDILVDCYKEPLKHKKELLGNPNPKPS